MKIIFSLLSKKLCVTFLAFIINYYFLKMSTNTDTTTYVYPPQVIIEPGKKPIPIFYDDDITIAPPPPPSYHPPPKTAPQSTHIATPLTHKQYTKDKKKWFRQTTKRWWLYTDNIHITPKRLVFFPQVHPNYTWTSFKNKKFFKKSKYHSQSPPPPQSQSQLTTAPSTPPPPPQENQTKITSFVKSREIKIPAFTLDNGDKIEITIKITKP